MRDANGFTYFLTDHLGSVSVVLEANGSILEQQRYLPFGQARTMVPYDNVTSTDFTFTGQRDLPDTGLMDFNARMYDAALGRFVQPDSIIPNVANPQSWNRYAYVLNDPIRYNDPTGHREACDDSDTCKVQRKYSKLSAIDTWKKSIKDKFGVTLSGNWTAQNAYRIYDSLSDMNTRIGGNLATITAGSTYTFQSNPDHYGGRTSHTGDITFWSFSDVSPYQNIYHEIAHSIDYKTGEFFTNKLRSQKVYTDDGQFVMGGPDVWSKPPGIYDRNSLGYNKEKVYDPAFTNLIIAEQHSAANGGNNANEEFGDLVANYVVGNFVTDPNDRRYQYGIARQNWVRSVFSLYFYTQNMVP